MLLRTLEITGDQLVRLAREEPQLNLRIRDGSPAAAPAPAPTSPGPSAQPGAVDALAAGLTRVLDSLLSDHRTLTAHLVSTGDANRELTRRVEDLSSKLAESSGIKLDLGLGQALKELLPARRTPGQVDPNREEGA